MGEGINNMYRVLKEVLKYVAWCFFGDFNAMCGREERRGINNMYRVIGWRGIYLIN